MNRRFKRVAGHIIMAVHLRSCKDCGALVHLDDLALHDHFHRQLGAST